jgi:hypothetical protein
MLKIIANNHSQHARVYWSEMHTPRLQVLRRPVFETEWPPAHIVSRNISFIIRHRIPLLTNIQYSITSSSVYTTIYFENFILFPGFKLSKDPTDGLPVADWPFMWTDGPIGAYAVADTGVYHTCWPSAARFHTVNESIHNTPF